MPLRRLLFLPLIAAVACHSGSAPSPASPSTDPNNVDLPTGQVWSLSTILHSTTGANSGAFEYTLGWNTWQTTGVSEHVSASPGAHYSVAFSGQRIALYATRDVDRGIANVTLDGNNTVEVDFWAAAQSTNGLVYLSPWVADGAHVLSVSVSGKKNPSSTGTQVGASRAVVWRAVPAAVARPIPSYDSLASSAWTILPAPVTSQSWNIDLPIYSNTVYGQSQVQASSQHFGGLADTFGDLAAGPLSEWDYTFHFSAKAGYSHVPQDRADALAMVGAWFTSAANGVASPWVTSMTSHYYYQHQAASWATAKVGVIGSVVGENVKAAGAHVAFTRGAGRQWNKPWSIDVSPWYGNLVLDYSANPVWTSADGNTIFSGPHNGHSVELMRRSYYLAWAAGASILTVEDASVNWFNGEQQDENGNFFLSPLGQAGQELYQSTHTFTQRGVPYAPIAILLPPTHGLGINPQAPFYGDGPGGAPVSLPPTPGDALTQGLLNAIWPAAFATAPWDESQYYLNNGALADMYDVLLTDVGAAVLGTYPVCVLGGDVLPDAALGATLRSYVSGGGTLIVNSANMTSSIGADFTGVQTTSSSALAISASRWLPDGETRSQHANVTATALSTTTAQPLWQALDGNVTLATVNNVGQGRVIVVAVDNLQDSGLWTQLLEHVEDAVSPVRIGGDVEHLLSRSPTGWVVTLINNRGVTKQPDSPTVVNPNAAQWVSVTLVDPGKKLASVGDVRGGSLVAVDTANGVNVNVAAGDVMVLDLVLVK